MILFAFGDPEKGDVCYRVSQRWGGLPSSQEEPNNESVTVTLSCRPGLCDPPSCDEWITQFTKTILHLNPIETFFHVECQLCPLVLGKPSALKSQRRVSQCTIIVIMHRVQCTASCRWEARAIPDYWRNSTCPNSMYYLCCVQFPSFKLTVLKPILSQMCYRSILK